MLFRDRYGPVHYERCLSVVFQRRLSTGDGLFKVFGNHRGLSAGRKRSRCQSDGKQLNDVAHTSGRDQRRIEMITVRFNVDV
jgi:hypothetical protein